MKILSVSILLFLKIAFLPSVSLLFYMAIAMVIDFITGIVKAKMQGQIRTSAGYRKTVVKFLQYGGSIAAGIVLANLSQEKGGESLKLLLSYVNDGLLVFIIYIEVTSVFENLYAIDNSSVISKMFIAPVLRILTWQINNNPLMKQLKKDSEKDEGQQQ